MAGFYQQVRRSSGCPLKRAKVHQQADEKALKKEGRDTKGRMGGGDKKQERKTGAIVLGIVPARHMHSDSNIQMLNDGSPLTSFTSSLFLILLLSVPLCCSLKLQ